MLPIRKPQILFVCTANICRSPTAEHLARHLPGGDRFEFASAGLLRAGTTCPDQLMQATSPRGVDLTGHRSRLASRELLRDADLVVTMEVGHLREITVLDPEAFAKTVPFLELDRMLRERPRTLPDLLDELAERDPSAYLSTARDGDVPDPYGGSRKAYAAAVEHIEGLVRTLTSRLLLPGEHAPASDEPPPVGGGAGEMSPMWRRFLRRR